MGGGADGSSTQVNQAFQTVRSCGSHAGMRCHPGAPGRPLAVIATRTAFNASGEAAAKPACQEIPSGGGA